MYVPITPHYPCGLRVYFDFECGGVLYSRVDTLRLVGEMEYRWLCSLLAAITALALAHASANGIRERFIPTGELVTQHDLFDHLSR